jgi:hypothetical protein
MDEPDEMEVKAWLMIGRHHWEALQEIEKRLMVLVGQTDDMGHVSDFIYEGSIDAKELIRKTKARNNGYK